MILPRPAVVLATPDEAEEEGNEYNAYPTAFQYLRSGFINCSPVCLPLFDDYKSYINYTHFSYFSPIVITMHMAKLSNIKGMVKELRPFFPRVKFLIIRFESGKDYYMAVSSFLHFIHILYVDNACKKIPHTALRAILAHELAHIQFPDKDERQIDLQLIEFGFKEDLIAFHFWHNKTYRKYKKKNGLTLKEINRMDLGFELRRAPL